MSAVEEYRIHTENHDLHGHSDRVSRKLADAAIAELEADAECPVCGAPGSGCITCLAELRCDDS